MRYLGQNSPSPWSRQEKVLRLCWILAEGTLFRWSPRGCFRWRNGLLRLFGARIASGEGPIPRVFPTVKIHFPWKLELAFGSLLGPGVRVYNLGNISLADGANVSQFTHLCSGTHDYAQWTMPLLFAPIRIGVNAWIAAECFIGPGVTIGELTVIGARSVVVKDQPDRMVCAGNPCRPIKARPDPR
jgi:putative colanic acid biosynthesis acetyltransferase WcaF